MPADRTQTEAAPAASADAEEQDVKIPVEAVDETPKPEEGHEADDQDLDEDQAGTKDGSEEHEMTEEEMVKAAIRAGEQAAADDFKVKYEQANQELVEVRQKLGEAEEARKASDAKLQEAADRVTRLQADWENFRRRTASERLAERERATEKLVSALLPAIDDIERAIDHAHALDMADDFKQFVDGVEAVHTKIADVLAHEGVEVIDPKGEAFNPLEHQAVGRVEDPGQYDETVNDVYQKGYRMGGRVLRSAMVTVTYGGEKRPAPEPEASENADAPDAGQAPEETGAEETQE